MGIKRLIAKIKARRRKKIDVKQAWDRKTKTLRIPKHSDALMRRDPTSIREVREALQRELRFYKALKAMLAKEKKRIFPEGQVNFKAIELEERMVQTIKRRTSLAKLLKELE